MVYLDTSIVAPLLLPEATSDQVERYLQNFPAGELSTSAWTKVEFSSLVARKLRMGELDERQADEVRAELDHMPPNPTKCCYQAQRTTSSLSSF